MKIIKVEPNKEPFVKEIGLDLKDLQKEVEGRIEAVYPFEDEVALICNEESKLSGMEPNRCILDDIIVGPFFICGLGEEEFTDVPDNLIEKYLDMFKL